MEIAREEDNEGSLTRTFCPKQNVSGTMGEDFEPEDEDEDEDIDFNPFLQRTPSPEASSSLSSENEEILDEEGKDQLEGALCDENDNAWLELGSEVEEDEFAGNYEDEDEDPDEDDNGDDDNEQGIKQGNKNQLELSIESDRVEMENNTLVPYSVRAEIYTKQCQLGEGNDHDSCNASGPDERAGQLTDKAEEELLGRTMDALPDLKSPRKPVIERQRGQSNDEEVEDAICKRTRAHYSLADLSLDELETFLQESDEDDYFQNVDDEEEYRKFLAAVAGKLEGNDGQHQVAESREDEDDDDEDNDADFEIEIEEALESDYDETTVGKGRKRKHWGTYRRPETREKRRQRASIQNKERLLGLGKTPLRPLLPLTTSPQTQSSTLEGKRVMADHVSSNGVHCEKRDLMNGFTAHQIGQLHCLIYEHVQLLVQVFSLCILEPSRQHIASETRRMLTELVDKRDQVLSWRKNPFPDFCFHPPYVHPSVLEYVKLYPMPNDTYPTTMYSSGTYGTQKTCQTRKSSRPSNVSPGSLSFANDSASWQCSSAGVPPPETCSEEPRMATGDSLPNSMDSGWVPVISGPVWSVLDAAPVGFVKEFLPDVDIVVQEYRQRYVEIGEYHSQCEREPLFPLCGTDPGLQAQKKSGRGVVLLGPNVVSSAQPQQKKTMAAALVESTKRQSVALVPKDIVKVVQRFYPLLNPALFPHKPPPAATANRVLFTDAEDELLAMGLMTYNNDWKSIQKRFLPCKSMHQIFVRQKNRTSSRAPENSIKAVRRMKASPLTSEEKACIYEGLRVLKFDWTKVWEYCVPYRDPALLPRQWRIAVGTQKSYKTDDATKERRRLYEARRRKSKAAQKECDTVTQTERQQFENDDGEENSGDDNMEGADEAYVHEAFLADWKPCSSRFMAAALPVQPVLGGNGDNFAMSCSLMQGGRVYHERTSTMQTNGLRLSTVESQTLYHNTGCPNLESVSQIPCTSQMSFAANPCLQSSQLTRRPIRTQVTLRPYRTRKKTVVQMVKLAPDLPTLNLPPSVRVIPQSMLMGYQSVSSDRLPSAQNRKSNRAPVMADPQCHLQTSKDAIEHTVAKPDSSTVAVTTIMSTSTACLGRSVSTERNMHLSKQNNGKGISFTFQKSPSTINEEQIPSSHRQNGPQKDQQLKSNERCPEINEADLHMHPLLLQNPLEVSAQCQNNNYGMGAQIPFSNLSRNPQYSDLNLLFNTSQGTGALKHQVTTPLASSKKASILTSSADDFHPLLQRSAEVSSISSSVSPYPSLHHSFISGAVGGTSTQVLPPTCVSRPDSGPTALQERNQLHQRDSAILFSVDDARELHVEKHVNNSNEKRTVVVDGSSSMEQEVPEAGNVRTLERSNTIGRRKQAKDQNILQQGICNTERIGKNGTTSYIQGCQAISDEAALYFHRVKSASGGDPIIVMSERQTVRFGDLATSKQSNTEKMEANVVRLKDDSLPEIVMEQEELSDSEDEINVQFECEEMGDSEGEDTGFQQGFHYPNKDEHSIEFEEEEIISEDDDVEEDRRLGNIVSNEVSAVSQKVMSASPPSFASKRQNSGRKRSTRIHCWASTVDSVGINSKKQDTKEGVGRSHDETVRFRCSRRNKKRIKETEETNDMHIRNPVARNTQKVNSGAVEILCEGTSQQSPVNLSHKERSCKSLGQISPHIADTGSFSDACEDLSLSKRQTTGSGVLHSEIGIGGSEGDKEDSTCHCVQEADRIAIEAAQVLTVIHQSPTDETKASEIG
eukprot:Gb_20931 [translate_table: standard]